MQIDRVLKTAHPQAAVSGVRRRTAPVLVASQSGALGDRRQGAATSRGFMIQAGALLAADAAAAGLSLGLAAAASRAAAVQGDGAAALLPWAICALLFVLVHLASHGHYTRRHSIWTESRDIVGAACGALFLTAMAAYLTRNETGQVPVLVGWAVFPCAALALRALARNILNIAGLWQIPVLVIGDAASMAAALETLRAAPHLGYAVVATLPSADLSGTLTGTGWQGLLRQRAARMVLLAYDEADPGRPSPHIIEALVRERIPLAIIRETHGLPPLGCEHIWFAGHETQMLCYATAREKPVSRAVKSVIDVAAAALGLAILLPLFAMIAALIKLDGGPVFFAHRRIGAGGRTFNCLKFRTMVQNSDEVLARLLTDDAAAACEWEATQKLRRDPRVTWVGRLLRKTSLDELPQLINVVRLQMSLVGPRPIVSSEVGRYAEDISYYYETRPGITGLWQISGRNDTTYARRVQLDRWYVKNWSIGQDMAILARTLPAVLSGRGAS